MPYKSKAKEYARSVGRKEYFRKRYKRLRGLIPKALQGRHKFGLSPNDVARMGEKSFLKMFVNSKWVGRPYDGICLFYGKVDIKTSKPYIYDSSGRKRWRFSIKRQLGKIDNFILFCLNENSEINKLLVVPAKGLKIVGITIYVGGKSKYDKFVVPHIHNHVNVRKKQ